MPTPDVSPQPSSSSAETQTKEVLNGAAFQLRCGVCQGLVPVRLLGYNQTSFPAWQRDGSTSDGTESISESRLPSHLGEQSGEALTVNHGQNERALVCSGQHGDTAGVQA